METPQKPQSEPKRLEYRSPKVVKLGKLADTTLALGNSGASDNGTGNTKKTG